MLAALLRLDIAQCAGQGVHVVLEMLGHGQVAGRVVVLVARIIVQGQIVDLSQHVSSTTRSHSG